jgi:hypothetical protein
MKRTSTVEYFDDKLVEEKDNPPRRKPGTTTVNGVTYVTLSPCTSDEHILIAARVCKHHAQGKKDAFLDFCSSYATELSAAADTFIREYDITEFVMWNIENFGDTHYFSIMSLFRRIREVSKILINIFAGKEAFIDDGISGLVSSPCKGNFPNLFLIQDF